MTSEFSDISIGNVEGIEGWNTVIIRSIKGSNIIETAVKDNILKIDELPENNLTHLKQASFNKKKKSRIVLEQSLV